MKAPACRKTFGFPPVYRFCPLCLVPCFARNSAKPQGVGFAGKARLAHELYLYLF